MNIRRGLLLFGILVSVWFVMWALDSEEVKSYTHFELVALLSLIITVLIIWWSLLSIGYGFYNKEKIQKKLAIIWALVSVWFVVLFGYFEYEDVKSGQQVDLEFPLVMNGIFLIMWWGLLCIGFWVSSWFSGDKERD